jgi:putative oxidoreductase
MRLLDRAQPVALLVLRIGLGIILLAHGKGKIFGGMAQHKLMVASLGVPAWLAYLSAGTEFFGGTLLIIGLLTRLVALAVVIEMLVAIFRVHLPHGLTGQGGYQFPLMVGLGAFVLIFFGAGPLSADWLWRGHGGKK